MPHANYVWHIDSNHKLILWRMVIHGAIDGFSVLMTIKLQCIEKWLIIRLRVAHSREQSHAYRGLEKC